MKSPQQTFQEAICAHWQCPPEAYPERVLAHCYYRHARPFLGLIKRLFPATMALDYYLIELVSHTQDMAELHAECDGFRYDHPHRGLLRWALRFRVSGKVLAELAHTVWEAKGKPSPAKYPEVAR